MLLWSKPGLWPWTRSGTKHDNKYEIHRRMQALTHHKLLECEDQPISVSKHSFLYSGAISWHSQQLMIVEDRQYLMLRKGTLNDEDNCDVFYLTESLQTVTVTSLANQPSPALCISTKLKGCPTLSELWMTSYGVETRQHLRLYLPII